MDVGASGLGLASGFALRELRVRTGSVLSLTDLVRNSAPSRVSEAVYVEQLIVESGATLNLNGIPLYARTAIIAGEVLRGNVSVVPDGGEIQLNRMTAGTIASAGEIDTWTLSGQGGRTIQLELQDPSLGDAPPLAPALASGQIQLVDRAGIVVGGAGVPLTLNDPGPYSIVVQGTNRRATGNYAFAVWDVTTDYYPLRLGQVEHGTLASPYSEDVWSFTVSQSSEVRLDLPRDASSSLTFDLLDPRGILVFQNISVDTQWTELPFTGNYQLVARSIGWQYATDYQFQVDVRDTGSIRPDPWEPNNTAPRAAVLSTGSGQIAGATIHVPSDEDWFQWVPGSIGTAKIEVAADVAYADLDLEIYTNGARGLVRLAKSSGRTSQEFVSLPVVQAGSPLLIRIVSADQRLHPGYSVNFVVEPDQDGDGIPDAWELSGIDVNQDGIVDLDLTKLGASPFHKDLFVEVDAMQGRARVLASRYRRSLKPDSRPERCSTKSQVPFCRPPWPTRMARQESDCTFNWMKSVCR